MRKITKFVYKSTRNNGKTVKTLENNPNED